MGTVIAEKFTFKVHKPTGKYRSFYTEYADIKLKGSVIGTINEASVMSSASSEERYSINLMIADSTEGGGFKWARIKKKFPSMNEAKEFANHNCTAIQKQYNLYLNF